MTKLEMLCQAEIESSRGEIEPGDQVETYLQCNINLYRPGSTLEPHRDDLLDQDNPYKPLTNTFFPGAVTWILAPAGASQKFRISLCKDCLAQGDATYDGCGWNRRAQHNVLQEELGTHNSVIPLSGDLYKYGLHEVLASNAGTDESQVADRMSLNFRIVRPGTWRMAQSSSALQPALNNLP
jgi:hypothetical protein